MGFLAESHSLHPVFLRLLDDTSAVGRVAEALAEWLTETERQIIPEPDIEATGDEDAQDNGVTLIPPPGERALILATAAFVARYGEGFEALVRFAYTADESQLWRTVEEQGWSMQASSSASDRSKSKNNTKHSFNHACGT